MRGSGGNAGLWEKAGVDFSGNTTESDAGGSDGSGGGKREIGDAEILDNSPAHVASAHCSQNNHHNECGLLEDNPQTELAPPDFTWGELKGLEFCYKKNSQEKNTDAMQTNTYLAGQKTKHKHKTKTKT